MATAAVILASVRHEAILVIIRLGLGLYRTMGPQDNVLVPESRVVWATVASELEREGYRLVTPADYAEACGLVPAEAERLVWEEGSLFALAHETPQGPELLVPLPEREEGLPEITFS